MIEAALQDQYVTLTGWPSKDELLAWLDLYLGAVRSEPRFLVFTLRIDYAVGGEVLPLFLDEDGTAHLELTKLSPPVKRSVLQALNVAG